MELDSLRRLRSVFKLSQEKFAVLVGVSVRTVARWEAGESAPSQLARRQLESLERLHQRLIHLLRPESIDDWMTRAHPGLGQRTPGEVLGAEGPDPLLRLLEDIPSAFGSGNNINAV